MRLIGFALFLGVFTWSGPVAAQDEDLDASRQRLADLQQKIERTIADLKEKREAAGQLTDELSQLDRETRTLKRQTRDSRAELKRIERSLGSEQQKLGELKTNLKQTEARVKKRLVALYKSGEDGVVMALMKSAATPLETAEKYVFLTRMVEHDRQLMADYRQQSQQRAEALAELERLQHKQQRVLTRQRRQEQILAESGKAKRQLLTAVRSDEQLLGGVLDELKAKAARLDGLVKKLETDLAQPYTGEVSDFAEQMGRLPWPVQGRIRIGYGTTRHPDLGTMLESHGLEIETPVGTPVKAVWAGKVLYASRLRGFGRLIIIDHGGKYYSLYAHVDRFDRQVGDQIAPGEVVAYSGDGGRDSLYFEIRHKGTPLDPQPWLRAR